MLSAMGGMIGIRPDGKDGEESFVAAHFVAGGGWDTGTIAGHLEEGTKVFGVMQVFVTEILDIDVIYPCQLYQDAAAHAVNDDGQRSLCSALPVSQNWLRPWRRNWACPCWTA